MSDRQTRWWEYLSRFNYKVLFTKGKLNKVADALSRCFIDESSIVRHPLKDYVDADIRLDPEMDYLTEAR
ncbi:hypothetical protein BDN72DRAFT_753024, partial [Pluteus cervinus]